MAQSYKLFLLMPTRCQPPRGEAAGGCRMTLRYPDLRDWLVARNRRWLSRFVAGAGERGG